MVTSGGWIWFYCRVRTYLLWIKPNEVSWPSGPSNSVHMNRVIKFKMLLPKGRNFSACKSATKFENFENIIVGIYEIPLEKKYVCLRKLILFELEIHKTQWTGAFKLHTNIKVLYSKQKHSMRVDFETISEPLSGLCRWEIIKTMFGNAKHKSDLCVLTSTNRP